MKCQIRKNVFETNSSSVHSLVIAKEGREKSELRVNADGEIEVEFGSFGTNFELFFSQDEKLSYLITCCYYLTREWDIEAIYENWNFRQIEDVICKYTGAKRIKILNHVDPEIDHQSIPYDGIEIINVWDEDMIIDFVFNKYVGLKTDRD